MNFYNQYDLDPEFLPQTDYEKIDAVKEILKDLEKRQCRMIERGRSHTKTYHELDRVCDRCRKGLCELGCPPSEFETH